MNEMFVFVKYWTLNLTFSHPIPQVEFFFVSPKQLRVFLNFNVQNLKYVYRLYSLKFVGRGCRIFFFSPSIAFIMNSIYKGLLEVTHKANEEKILL